MDVSLLLTLDVGGVVKGEGRIIFCLTLTHCGTVQLPLLVHLEA